MFDTPFHSLPKRLSLAWLRETQQRNMFLLVVLTLGILITLEKFAPFLSLAVLVLGFIMIYCTFLTVILVTNRLKERLKHQFTKEKLLELTDLANPLSMLEDPLEAEETPPPLPFTPVVCVLIPCHNESAVIAQTLQRMMQLEYTGHLYFCVINDRSTDDTGAVLDALAQETLPYPLFVLHRTNEAIPGKSAVLNDAVAYLHTLSGSTTNRPCPPPEVLCVFDADAQVEADFIQANVALLEPENVMAMQARKRIMNHESHWLLLCQELEYTFDAHLQVARDIAGSAVELRGNGMMVKTSALEQLGGWNEASITDDLDLSTRIHLHNGLIAFSSTHHVWEEGVTTVEALIKQRRRWAEGSLRRYLDYGGDIFFSSHVSVRTRVELWAYWLSFLFPILLTADVVVMLISTLLDHASPWHQVASLMVTPLFVLLFIPTIYVAIRRWHRPSRWVSLKQALMTGVFMSCLWLPIVFYTFNKVLFNPQAPFYWAKTERQGPFGRAMKC